MMFGSIGNAFFKFLIYQYLNDWVESPLEGIGGGQRLLLPHCWRGFLLVSTE